jgi:hypothetical protein
MPGAEVKFQAMAPLIGLSVMMPASFILNIPLGMWRTRTRKFSPAWFISIHLAVPLIYFLRTFIGLGIGPSLFNRYAILGQIFGGTLRKKKRREKIKFR